MAEKTADEILLEDVKEEIKVTWTDEDPYLNKMIARGKASLEGQTGTTLDFDVEGQPKILLLNYCRYDYNNAIEHFKENFQKELLELKLKEAVKDRVDVDEG